MDQEYFAKRSKSELQNQDLTRPDWTEGLERKEGLLWLDKNENIDPIYHNVIKSVLDKAPVQWLTTYPESAKLYKKIAEQESISASQCLLTAGSDGAIRHVFDGFVKNGDNVIHTSPTFAMYPVYCKTHGAIPHPIDYKMGNSGPHFDLADLLQAVDEIKPKLVCLPNPDSPTGTVLDPTEIRTLVEKCHRAGSLVLIDEAYYPFYKYTAMPLIDEYPNLIVARTFSKAWGISGLRIGYLASNSHIAQILHKIRPMYEVNTFAVNFTYHLLDHVDELQKSVNRLNSGKDYFIAEMNKMGFETPRTYGNFLHVNFAQYSRNIESLLQNNVYYRQSFSHPSLACYSRITATTKENFEPIVELIKNGITTGGSYDS